MIIRPRYIAWCDQSIDPSGLPTQPPVQDLQGIIQPLFGDIVLL